MSSAKAPAAPSDRICEKVIQMIFYNHFNIHIIYFIKLDATILNDIFIEKSCMYIVNFMNNQKDYIWLVYVAKIRVCI